MILSFLRLPSGCQELEVEHPALSLFSLLPLSTSSFSPGFSATWFLCWREGERDRTGLRRSNPSSHACTMRFALTGNQDLGISSLTLRVGSHHFAGGHSGKLDMQEEPGSGEGQVRFQQCVNRELPDVQAGFRKGRGTRDQIANICWIMEKTREFQKSIYFCFIDYAKAFDCVDHNKLWKILKEMGIPDHLICLLRNLYACAAE